jgi:hypothetical protein
MEPMVKPSIEMINRPLSAHDLITNLNSFEAMLQMFPAGSEILCASVP